MTEFYDDGPKWVGGVTAPVADVSDKRVITQFHGNDVWRDEEGTVWVRQRELVAAVTALGESRARYGDLEARLVEAEAVVADAAEALRVKRLTVEAWKAYGILSAAPSVVLTDHDKEVAARAWDEGAASEATAHICGDVLSDFANPYRSGGTQ